MECSTDTKGANTRPMCKIRIMVHRPEKNDAEVIRHKMNQLYDILTNAAYLKNN